MSDSSESRTGTAAEMKHEPPDDAQVQDAQHPDAQATEGVQIPDDDAAHEELVAEEPPERPPEQVRKAALATLGRKEGALRTLLDICQPSRLPEVEGALEETHAAFAEFEVADRQTPAQHKRAKTFEKRRDQYWGLLERARRWISIARGIQQSHDDQQQGSGRHRARFSR